METILGFVLGNKLIVGNIAVAILPFLLPNAWLEGICYKIGRVMSIFLRQKVGKGPGETIETNFQGTVSAALNGLTRGLDEDDKS
jgi:hypothetical protein